MSLGRLRLNGLGALGAGSLRPPPGLRIQVDSDPEETVLSAFFDDVYVGMLTMLDARAPREMWTQMWMRRACARAMQALSARAGRNLKVAMVLETEIDRAYWGRGVGLSLYAKAAQLAAARGQAIVPNACLYDADPEKRGHTSEMAEATWQRLAQLPGMLVEFHKGRVVAVYAGGAR